MASTPIPNEVQQFLYDHVTSAAQLEVLLLLADSRQADWNAAEITATLRSQQELVAHALSDLQGTGLLGIATDPKHDLPRYSYQPRDAGMARAVSTLADIYRERRHTVLDIIYSKPLQHRPASRLQAFSDAFRLRSNEDK